MRNRSEIGNILFIILLAIVLFAALGIAVTNAVRGSGKDASQESVDAQVASLLSYGQTVETALSRMTLTSGYKFEDIDYRTSISGSGWIPTTNAACLTTSCRLFHPDGGGVPPFLLDRRLRNTTITQTVGNSSIFVTKIDGIGSPEPDVALYSERVSEAACRAINRAVGIGDVIPVDPGADGGNAGGMAWYSGGTIPSNVAHRVGNNDTRLAGRTVFCSSWGNATIDNVFWYVLVAR